MGYTKDKVSKSTYEKKST